jgi:YbbR domain-containing protein
MRVSRTQLVLRNWPLKFAALFFALMLYVAVGAQQPLTETFALRLSVAPPPGRELRQAPPDITVTVQGKGSEILKLRSIPRTIAKTVPDTLTGSVWRLHLQPGDVTIPKGVEVQVSSISPSDVDIVLDSAARREVRIVPRVTLDQDSGFALLGLTAVPATARLIGPPQSLAGIDSVTTQPIQIASVPGTMYRTVALDTHALGVARVVPREVRLVAEVAALARRVFAAVPVTTAASGFAGWELVSERVQVSVHGPAARVQALTRDSVRVVAHLVGPGGRSGYARLSVQAPSGITARAIPDSVALKRKGGRAGRG